MTLKKKDAFWAASELEAIIAACRGILQLIKNDSMDNPAVYGVDRLLEMTEPYIDVLQNAV